MVLTPRQIKKLNLMEDPECQSIREAPGGTHFMRNVLLLNLWTCFSTENANLAQVSPEGERGSVVNPAHLIDFILLMLAVPDTLTLEDETDTTSDKDDRGECWNDVELPWALFSKCEFKSTCKL